MGSSIQKKIKVDESISRNVSVDHTIGVNNIIWNILLFSQQKIEAAEKFEA
jgi:hypothetical protein